uniref:CX domain-containing protein n=1 Tax=Meloidogyne hapla TaxID=6305 RepID=A0A1I8BNY1_MELHA
MTDLLAQRDSTGIYYEPYSGDFKLCIYEEANVQGRNERYEFRCDAHLSCCGRACCIPAAAAAPIPLWLLILLLFLALLLLLALLYLLYKLCCAKRKGGVKETGKRTTTTRRSRGTRPYEDGYRGGADYGEIDRDADRDRFFRDRVSYAEMPNGGRKTEEVRTVETGGQRGGPFRRSFHEEETFEEEFHEEIEQVEKTGAPRPQPIIEERKPTPTRTPPKKLTPKPSPTPHILPSQVEEMDIPAPIPVQAVERELRGSRQSLATVLSRRSESPQRAQHAFYRPLTSDPIEEIDLPMPKPIDTRTGDTRQLLGEAEIPVEKIVETPEAKRAQHMFIRPGFDNIPAYN